MDVVDCWVSSLRIQTLLSPLMIASGMGLGLAETEAVKAQTLDVFATIEQPQQMQDCGDDEACLITNAGLCRPTQVQFRRSLEMLGISTNAPTQMQIWGLQGETCVLHTQSLSSEEGFSSITTQEMQSAGLSDSMMELMNRNRVNSTCLFDSPVGVTQFLQILTEQQKGSLDLFTTNTGTSTAQLLINGRPSARCRVQRSS